MTQKELGYVELEWTCKHCGTINPGLKRVCTNCGAPISVEDKLELPDQQELITDKEKLDEAKKGPAIQCPYCNVLNPADTKICIQCGGDIPAGLARQAGEVLGAYETSPVPDKPCPFCNQPVKANAQRCPNCGGSLVEQAKPAAVPASPKKIPVWLIAAIIALGVLCFASVIAFFVMSSRTSDVTASVSDMHWQLSIDILEKQPVQKSAWSEDVPVEAQDVSCQDEYKETSNIPAPNATEVCGTPYTIDQGSGAGKVVQDCKYRIYASYCDFTVLDWIVVNTAVVRGNDNNPQWPMTSLQSGQQEGNRHETYQVTFIGDGQTYSYKPVDTAEFSQFDIGSRWILSINTFGDIKDLRSK
jgi:RNA polymerase subunit RPABC4/transcription elongation factor Spt4